jgi:hypothetical protein
MAIEAKDLVLTYVKLSKRAAVYETPELGDKGGPVWFYKEAGQVTGKLFSWVDTSPTTGAKYKSMYLMFKSGDDFTAGVKPYFVKFEPKIIDWNFSKQQLIAKNQLDMNFFEKFVDDMENMAIDYGNGLLDYAKSGLKWGVIIGGTVLFFGTVVIPYIKFRVLKSTARDLIKEGRQ